MTTKTVPKSLVALAALVAIGAGAGAAGLASAQTPTAVATTQPKADHRMGPGMHGRGERGVMGTVSAVNGTTLTVTKADGTTYTVDASSAKVSKVIELSVGDIKVGDTIGAQGTLSGTSLKAVHIMDGVPPMPQGPPASH